MKKIMFIIIGVAFMLGCSEKKNTKTVGGVTVVTIDGCEYFKCNTYGFAYVLTHKGNCTNSIHIYNKK